VCTTDHRQSNDKPSYNIACLRMCAYGPAFREWKWVKQKEENNKHMSRILLTFKFVLQENP